MTSPDYEELLEHTDTVVLPDDSGEDADVRDDATTSAGEDASELPGPNASHFFLT